MCLSTNYNQNYVNLQRFKIGPGVLACATRGGGRSEAIVFTYFFFLFFFLYNIYFLREKKLIFARFFLHGQHLVAEPLVPGVFTHFKKKLRLLLFTHFGETPVAINLSYHYDFLFFCAYFFASFASEQ